MLELGQPMHAWDAHKLTGELVVRRAVAGEKLTTLDDVERQLHQDDLVITDDTGVVSLAAVMGGASTEVSSSTVDVLLEAAHWDPISVARTARRHKLPSEASKRYERGVDPALAAVAADRAARLLHDLAGGTIDERVLDLDARPGVAAIALPVQLPARISGVNYPHPTVVARLREVGCAVEIQGETLIVTPASWRGDLADPADLVEEVIRLEGYDTVPSVLPPAPASAGLTVEQRRRRSVSRALAEAGYTEVLSYPFVSPAIHEHVGAGSRERVLRVANPLSDQEPELRTSLLPGLLRTVIRNVGRGQRDVALFELGLVYLAREGRQVAPKPGVMRRPSDSEIAELYAAVPHQPLHIAAVLTGDRDPAGWWGEGRQASWADAIEAARLVAEVARVELSVRQADQAPWHPGRCAALVFGESSPGAGDGTVIGHAGELHPRVVAELDLPARTAAMELDLSALPTSAPALAPEISAFPSALLDVAVVVPWVTPEAQVAAALGEGAGELLESLRLFDVYTGEQVGAEHKSLAYKLAFRAPDRTLTVEEATAARDAAVAEANRRLGAVIRG